MPFIEGKTPFLGSLFTLLIKAISCRPDLAFPINSQVPPVAYALLPYSFEFAATTFISNGPQVSYSLSNGPEWLDIDTVNRRLSGTPHSNDVGVTTFQLTASDVTGDATTSVTFVVLESTDLTVQEPIIAHLAEVGPFSSPRSLLLRPSQPFAFKFDSNLFTGTNVDTKYYAISADNSPLPSWLQFDATELLFSGNSPPLLSTTAPAQTYGIRLIASNVPGFAEAVVDFDIVVQFHILAFSTPSQSTILGATGQFLRTTPLRDSLMLDDQPVLDDQILNIIIDGPPWVQLDKSQISLNGRPETDANSTITISVTDIFHDVANATWILDFQELSSSPLGVVANIATSAGEYLAYTFDVSKSYSTMQVDIDHRNGLSWLNYNASNLTLYGEVPLYMSPAVWNVSISFQNTTTNATGIFILRLTTSVKPTATTPVLDGTDMPRNPSSSIGATATSPTTTNRHVSKGDWNRVVLGVCLSIVGAVVIGLICVLVWLRRRRRCVDKDNNLDAATRSARISVNSDGSNELPRGPLMPVLEHPEPVRSNPPLRPPKIDLTWSNDSLQKAKSRLSGSRPSEQQRMSRLFNSGPNEADSQVLRSPTRTGSVKREKSSSIGEWQPFPIQDTLLASLLRPPNSPRRISDARAMRKSLQNSSSRPSVGLPDRRSGAGHGSGILSEAIVDQNRRDTWNLVPMGDKHRSTVALESFPVPPSQSARVTARAISPFGAMFDAIEESLSFETQRQKWHTERARARLEGAARFSNRGSSRLVSASRYNFEKSNLVISTETGSVDTTNGNDKNDSQASGEPSWSKWSGIGSAAHDPNSMFSTPRTTEPNIINRSSGSIASSRQFDSATSSGSQWVDESPSSKEQETTGPRLPFSPLRESQGNMSRTATGATRILRQGRVADKRNVVNVETSGLTRNQSSQQGSLRYI